MASLPDDQQVLIIHDSTPSQSQRTPETRTQSSQTTLFLSFTQKHFLFPIQASSSVVTMTRLRDVAVIFASSVALAQDPQQVLNGGSRLLTTPLGTQVNTLGSCLMGSACQRVGKKITIDDIVISTDGQGNTKCCPLGKIGRAHV